MYQYGSGDYRGCVRLFPTPSPPKDRMSNMPGNSCPWSPQLCCWIIELCTKVGDTVADMFCGSGELGRMAAALGRNVIMVDNSEAALVIANQGVSNLVDLTKQIGGYTFDGYFGSRSRIQVASSLSLSS